MTEDRILSPGEAEPLVPQLPQDLDEMLAAVGAPADLPQFFIQNFPEVAEAIGAEAAQESLDDCIALLRRTLRERAELPATLTHEEASRIHGRFNPTGCGACATLLAVCPRCLPLLVVSQKHQISGFLFESCPHCILASLVDGTCLKCQEAFEVSGEEGKKEFWRKVKRATRVATQELDRELQQELGEFPGCGERVQ